MKPTCTSSLTQTKCYRSRLQKQGGDERDQVENEKEELLVEGNFAVLLPFLVQQLIQETVQHLEVFTRAPVEDDAERAVRIDAAIFRVNLKGCERVI